MKKRINKKESSNIKVLILHPGFFSDSQIPTPLDKLEALWISDQRSQLSPGVEGLSFLSSPTLLLVSIKTIESSAGHSFTVE